MEIAIQGCAAGTAGVDTCQCLEDRGRCVAAIKIHQRDLPARRLAVINADSGRAGESSRCRA